MAQDHNLNPDISEYRHRLRHSTSHVMAAAVLDLFPEAKMAIGPSTDDGFYYDFLVENSFTPADLESIEEKMREQIKLDLPFNRMELSRNDANRQFAHQPFKLEIIEDIPTKHPISVYQHGKFEDLCEGPHVKSTGDIQAFKLQKTAGAYWRGDESRPMLQRIYGTAFESQTELDKYLLRMEEAQRRDHRKLGRELGLFIMDPISPASPFYLPKGTIIYNLLVNYVQQLYRKYGYQEVITPQIFDVDLWKKSGHYDHYSENMFFLNTEGKEYGIKPMNCPAHALIYASQLYSYRELPLRISDFGRLHRYERSGVVQGLTRVRTFSQDDAHIFCTPEQISKEIQQLIQMFMETYQLFKFEAVKVVLSLRPEKRVGSNEIWDKSEEALKNVIQDSGLVYTQAIGEGAFYGPKIDFFVPDALEREWQLGTIQLDFELPQRFGLEYVAEDGSRQRPVVLHRAMLGSIDRFMGVLIEHYGGVFPTWLTPIQAIVIPIADRHLEYANEVKSHLFQNGLRVEVDSRGERMNLKIRNAQMLKIPYMLIVGDNELDNNTVSVRSRIENDTKVLSLKATLDLIQHSSDSKT